MIICIDVGNTNVKYAIFDGDDLKFSYRVATDLRRTSDEYGAQLIGMLDFNGVAKEELTGGIISSVVPSLDYTMGTICSKCTSELRRCNLLPG